MKVMIGVDPDKGSHAATMLDRHEHEVRRITVVPAAGRFRSDVNNRRSRSRRRWPQIWTRCAWCRSAGTSPSSR